jgi:type I restriction enzyme M protein
MIDPEDLIMINIRKLESELWESADLLRAGSKLTSNQYCMPVLGLIFLRYAFSRFKMVEAEILKNRPSRGGRVMPVEASDFSAKSALFLPKEAQYDYLVNLPENIAAADIVNKDGHTMNSLGEVVNNAMQLIEDQSEQLTGVLPKSYTDFSDELLAELLRIFNNSALDDVGGDVIGRIYEYFLNKFAKNIASDDGVFFTPKSLVKMIVNILEPKSGILLDPACGSGGMFVQTGDFVVNPSDNMTFYGQEKVEYNAQLCLMNIAVHGLTGVIKSGDAANTFYHDAHNLNGKCDYIMANPPFNVDKVKAESCESAGRLPFGMPSVNKNKEVGNGNYLWISYFYSYLNEKGRAGFVMASSATDSQGKDKDIREQLVKTGDVDVMISVGNNFFYTKSLPCSLWFFDKTKNESIRDKVLFIDARNYYTVVDRTLNEWSDWQLQNLNAIVWLHRGEIDKYKNLIYTYRDDLWCSAQVSWDDELIEAIGATEDEHDKIKPFSEIYDNMKALIKKRTKEAKHQIAAVAKKEKKALEQKLDEKLAQLKTILETAEEALWLYEKFGDGEYKDVLGLCKAATISEIEEKGWSLTPGAYVGVAPVEDDGVDFAERMAEIHRELLSLQAESNDLMDTISKNLKEMGI